MNLPPDIKHWLNARGITDEVLNHNNIQFENNQIVIPIYGKDKTFLFNKYRRSPFSENGPKYTYDRGAEAALYNTNNLWFPTGAVIVVEGELDAMRLQSGGYFAVSTTGGSGTFKKEWADLLAGYEIYICYDNDAAGITGTIRLLEVFPDARVIAVPREDAVKDITDYLSKHGGESFVGLFGSAKNYCIPQDSGDLKAYTKSLAAACEAYQIFLRENPDAPLEKILLTTLQERWEAATRKLRYKRPAIKDTDAIKRARAVPVTEFIKVNRMGFASCVNHNEKTPSMKYYKSNNKVKCFGCGFNGDTIDVVQKMFNLTAGEAIKKINS